MLSDERMMAIATEFNYDARHWVDPKHKDATRDVFLRAIRLAVAETAEACAAVCDNVAVEYWVDDKTQQEVAAQVCAAAIREKARTK